MIFRLGCILLVSACFAQQHSAPSGDRQVRLEDIERENANTQKTTKTNQQSNYPVQQQISQQQLAAYQQQLLLQQLQQQYFAPQPIAYGNFGGVPLMIIPSNHLGVGTQSPLPLQAYFIPQDQQFYQPQQQQVYIQPQQRYQPQVQQHRPQAQTLQVVPQAQTLQVVPQAQTLQVVPQTQHRDNVQLTPSLQVQPNHQAYQTNFPNNNFVYQQPQLVYQQQQQPYNAYNAIYQQRQQKNNFAAGVKSTPAPAVKPNQQNVNQGTSFINYKSF